MLLYYMILLYIISYYTYYIYIYTLYIYIYRERERYEHTNTQVESTPPPHARAAEVERFSRNVPENLQEPGQQKVTHQNLTEMNI